MPATIIIKQGDTQITFKDIPTINNVPLTPANVVGCTVNFMMKSFDGSTLIRNAGTIGADASFSYSPTASDVAVPGKFQQEWELIYPGGATLTFPNQSFNVVNILPELG